MLPCTEQHTVSAVEQALAGVHGVKSVAISLMQAEAKIEYDACQTSEASLSSHSFTTCKSEPHDLPSVIFLAAADTLRMGMPYPFCCTISSDRYILCSQDLD